MAEDKRDRLCVICEKIIPPYTHYAVITCSNKCKTENKNIKTRIRRQRYRMIEPPPTCRRCHIKFRPGENENRKYCYKCIKLINTKEEYHKCLDCPKKISSLKKRCTKCALIQEAKKRLIIKEQVKVRNYKAKVTAEAKGVTKDKPKIDPKWTNPRGSKRNPNAN